MTKGAGEHVEADGIESGVAEKIERVGLKRDRSCEQAGHALDEKHRGVDDQNQPQHAAIAGANGGVHMVSPAAIGHSPLASSVTQTSG